MRKITLFASIVAVFVLIGIDTWLCMRTIDPGRAGWFDFQSVKHHYGCEGFAYFALSL